MRRIVVGMTGATGAAVGIELLHRRLVLVPRETPLSQI
jgi:3-polyprenyl-4-hydroxybenzoate decarboxylase